VTKQEQKGQKKQQFSYLKKKSDFSVKPKNPLKLNKQN
jgi:hypothetical protein